jgi:hypothetical protein
MHLTLFIVILSALISVFDIHTLPAKVYGQEWMLANYIFLQQVTNEDSTVEGLDEDGNGVRDDLQSYIDTTYPGDENELLRRALTEIAKSSQQVLLSVQVGDESQVIAVIIVDLDNRSCLFDIFGEKAFDYAGSLTSEIVNTRARMELDFQADEIFGGQVWSLRRNRFDSCKFDVSELQESEQ